MSLDQHPLSPRLDHCPPSLPRAAYMSDDWFARETGTLFARQWMLAGRLDDFAPGTMIRVQVGAAPVILCRAGDGALSAWHNTCRHRGAELCRDALAPLGRLIACPYHAWSYAASDGRLLSTAHAQPTADFRREDHALLPVAHRVWAGFVFLSTAGDPPPLMSDVPLSTLDNWPMNRLATGHQHTVELACNWKTFWENYSECLHCPGIHPELCARVPIYGDGIMGPTEAPGWMPDTRPPPALEPGAESWTPDGAPCGPVFPGLTEAERQAGHTFVTLWPSAYIVAHVDYVRSVRLQPLSATRTRLVVEWHFPPETLAQPGFDAAAVATFAERVLSQDSAAAEMNQRGMASPAFVRGTLMPEEYEVHRFEAWVLAEMEANV